MEAPRIEHVDARRGLDAVHHVEQHEALGVAEGAGEREARMEILDRPDQDLFRAEALEPAGADIVQHAGIDRFSDLSQREGGTGRHRLETFAWRAVGSQTQNS